MIASRMSGSDWALLLLLAVLWGGSFFFVEIILPELDPLTLVAARVVLAALTLWALVPLGDAAVPRGWAVWSSFLVLGFLGNAVPFSLLALGQTTIGAGLASIFNATTPLFTALIAALALDDERMTRPRAIGIVLGFAGVVVMVGPNALAGLFDDVAAAIACLGAAAAYGVTAVFARRFRRMGVAPRGIALGQLTMSSVVMVPAAFLFAAPGALAALSPGALAALLTLAIVSTAIAYLIYFALIERAGATSTSLVTFLVPATAILLGVVVLGEELVAGEIVGMALILSGLVAIDGRLLARRPARPSPASPH